MKASRVALTLVVGLAGLAAMPAAWACEIVRTPWGMRLTNCNLSSMYPGRYELSVDQNPAKPRFRLPNLRTSRVDLGLIGKTAVLSVDVQNDGMGNAGQFEVAVVSSVNNPLAGGASVGTVTQYPAVVASLAAGASASLSLTPGHVELPNRSQDWDICTMVVVDPPSASRASGSEFEANESDNLWSGCCHVSAGSSQACL